MSERSGGELSLTEIRYAAGGLPSLLDVVELRLIRPAADRFQTENYVIDPGASWVRTGVFPRKDLRTICDAPDSLWEAHDNSFWGTNDRIAAVDAGAISGSLFLIRIAASTVVVKDEDAYFGPSRGHRKVRLEFDYNGIPHRLPVTDIDVESEYASKEDGNYCLPRPCYACISLGLPYTDNFCYLFVAAIVR